MKKILPVFLSAIICVATSNTTKAQQLLASASVPAKANFTSSSSNEKTTARTNETVATKAATKAIKANFKAVENLKKQFANLSNVTWINYNEVIMARFDKDDVQTSVSYNKKGQWLHTISYYDVYKMPKDIKVQVEKTFPEYNVTGASEIKEDNTTFYLVYIENCTSLKQISVINGELAVYKEYRKNN